MKTFLNKKIKGIPVYGMIAGFLTFMAMQQVFYKLGDVIPRTLGLTWQTSETAIDAKIPYLVIFIIPYVYSFIFWVIGLIVPSKCNKEFYWDYIVGVWIALTIGTITMCIYPTMMDRYEEGLYELAGDGPLGKLAKFIYDVDGGQQATCLFPSFHCLTSMVCVLGVYKKKEFSKGWQLYTWVVAILIFIATVTVKQHYFMDVIFGIGYAILGVWLGTHFHLGRGIARMLEEK